MAHEMWKNMEGAVFYDSMGCLCSEIMIFFPKC